MAVGGQERIMGKNQYDIFLSLIYFTEVFS